MMVSAYRRVLFTLGPYRWFSVFIDRVVTPTERVLYRLTGGRLAVAHVGRHAAVPELMLITRGRKSGRERRAAEDDFRRMWPRMLEIWPAWAVYRMRTDREFRAFFLEPA